MIVMPSCFNAGDTIEFFFDSYGGSGESVTVTNLAVTDVECYRDGSTTQRASDNGITLLDTDGVDFDGTVGLNGFKIDTSDNSDAGFWANGSRYLINVNAVTINSQTVRFSYYLTLGYSLRPATAGRTLEVDASGIADADVRQWLGTACATPTNAGVPEVDMTHINGALTNGSPAVGSRPKLYLQQLRAECSISGEGAIHVNNAHASGVGQYNNGGAIGQDIYGGSAGQRIGSSSRGQYIYSMYGTGQEIEGATSAINLTGVSSGLYVGSTRVLSADGLTGKVLGGGSGTITGVGARVVDDSGNSLPTAATIATAVWAAGTRTLTSFGTLISDIWSAVTRTLTAGTKDTEIDAIKAKTDNLPASPAAVSDIPTVVAIAAQVTTDHGAGSYVRNTEPLDAAGVRSAVGLASANLDTQLASLPTAAETATEVWDSLTGSLTTAGSIGKKLADASFSGTSVIVSPTATTVSTGEVSKGSLTAYQDAGFTFAFTVRDSDQMPVDLSGKALKFLAWVTAGTNAIELTTTGGDITIGGTNNNVVTVNGTSADTATAQEMRYVLRNVTDDNRVLAEGEMKVKEANS